MNSNKYVALDVHSASIVAKVHNDAGKYVMESILETKARTVRNFMKGISGKVHVTFEEGTQAAWLYDLIKPMVAEVVVCEPRHNKLLGFGSKSDKIDTDKLAELLRLGSLRPVYHGQMSLRPLKELAHSYDCLVSDLVRVMAAGFAGGLLFLKRQLDRSFRSTPMNSSAIFSHFSHRGVKSVRKVAAAGKDRRTAACCVQKTKTLQATEPRGWIE